MPEKRFEEAEHLLQSLKDYLESDDELWMINTAKLFMVKYKFSESAFILSSILKKKYLHSNIIGIFSELIECQVQIIHKKFFGTNLNYFSLS